MTTDKSTADLEVSDQAIMLGATAGLSNSARLVTVVRVTKTQLLVEIGPNRELRFSRKTGRQVGGDTWARRRLLHPESAYGRHWADWGKLQQARSHAKHAISKLRDSFDSSTVTTEEEILGLLADVQANVGRYLQVNRAVADGSK